MTYRDDLGAAHARIAALEAQLRSVGDPSGEAAEEELVQLRMDNQRLQQELQRVRAEHDRARELLAGATATQAELARLREERDRLVARVQVLQNRRDVAARPAPATAPATVPTTAARPASIQPVAARPTLWEHNRALPAIKRGERSGAWCPVCRVAGEEVELVRKLGRFVKVRSDELYESVACPRCLFVGLARKK